MNSKRNLLEIQYWIDVTLFILVVASVLIFNYGNTSNILKYFTVGIHVLAGVFGIGLITNMVVGYMIRAKETALQEFETSFKLGTLTVESYLYALLNADQNRKEFLITLIEKSNLSISEDMGELTVRYSDYVHGGHEDILHLEKMQQTNRRMFPGYLERPNFSDDTDNPAFIWSNVWRYVKIFGFRHSAEKLIAESIYTKCFIPFHFEKRLAKINQFCDYADRQMAPLYKDGEMMQNLIKSALKKCHELHPQHN